MLGELFDHFVTHLEEDKPEVQVADFVSGMTDRYAVCLYEDLKIPQSWKRR